MKLSHPNCPECRERAEGSCDWVPGLARLSYFEDDPECPFEWGGETDVFWDGQLNEADLRPDLTLTPFGAIIPEGLDVPEGMRIPGTPGGRRSEEFMVVECYNGHRWLTGVKA